MYDIYVISVVPFRPSRTQSDNVYLLFV